MYNIKYLSKNSEDYTDKQKVYFSCHPDDRKLYLDVLKNDIFSCADCVMLYDENPFAEYDESDYKHLLLSCNLIVIPVTAKYLSEANRSRDFDVKFALENFIPVMPVMVENGLEQSFNRIVGDLQLLDRTNHDSTAVTYKEKLKNYLNSVLADTQLLQDINSSFCAKIFLSYRKKDRAHANRLMQLIHSFDDFRDIAIWYDEFLTTGEDYNKSIENALVQSDIFALAVTPNLLEKGNYVMTTEFPDAVKLQKDILAAELLPTDKAAFAVDFSACPAPISASQPQLVASRLQQILAKLGISPAKDTPQHRYLIGLAYLGGINVEKNTEKALSLIKSAAKDGLAKAMQKLANMYLNGEGVAIDVKRAALWQQKFVDLLEDEHDENPSEEKARLLVKEMYNLCLLYSKSMDYDNVLNITEDIEFYCRPYLKNDIKFFWHNSLIQALLERENALQQKRMLREALQCCQLTLDILEEYYKITSHPLILRYMTNTFYNIYDIYVGLGNDTEAQKYFELYRKFSIQNSKSSSYMPERVETIKMHITSAFTYQRNNNIPAALKEVQLAILLCEQFLSESKDQLHKVLQIHLARAYNLKALLVKSTDLQAAHSLLEKAARILEDSYNTSDASHGCIELANVYYNLAATEHIDAEAYMEKAIDVLKENLGKVSTQETILTKLYMTYNDCIVFYALHGRRDLFEKYVQETTELFKSFSPELMMSNMREYKIMEINIAKGQKILKEKNL